jgi:hypothetical protein
MKLVTVSSAQDETLVHFVREQYRLDLAVSLCGIDNGDSWLVEPTQGSMCTPCLEAVVVQREAESKVCTACSWDGMLTKLPCPTCKKEQWYCGDCNACGKAFNCGTCQQPQQSDINAMLEDLNF